MEGLCDENIDMVVCLLCMIVLSVEDCFVYFKSYMSLFVFIVCSAMDDENEFVVVYVYGVFCVIF